MSVQARGTFEVSFTPHDHSPSGEGSVLATHPLTKRYHGPLEAESHGHMLSASSTEVKDSRAYVAVERVVGTLDGKRGSFALVHRGIMSARGRELRIDIVPDSGSDELKGIEGTLDIAIGDDGSHRYDLTYTLSTSS